MGECGLYVLVWEASTLLAFVEVTLLMLVGTRDAPMLAMAASV